MDGLLVIDKPVGPTSHDVVARMRRVLSERRIGHTGTLDPLASGVLPLVIGRATRLAQFLNTSDKCYEAVVRLGISTDTHDAAGQPTGSAYAGEMPSREVIERTLDAFRGTYLQQPPAFSAKKIAGRRSYELARAHARRGRETAGDVEPAAADRESTPPAPAPVVVTAHQLDVIDAEEGLITLRLVCSAGFYVRSLAHDLGRALGTGAHLAGLRRTAAGGSTLAEAVPLSELDDARGLERARAALIPLAQVLPGLPAIMLTDRGTRRAVSGIDLEASDTTGAFPRAALDVSAVERFRLLDPSGALVGVAELSARSGFLHPAVVLM